MATFKERVTARLDGMRARRPAVDHVFRMFGHYSRVEGNVLAGAVTYYGFLSFFPILALAFFVIGRVATFYPGARDQLTTAIDQIFPHMIGTDRGQISLATFEQNASTLGIVGLVGVLYSGLGWLSGMRNALEVMFRLPRREQPNLLLGKARDLVVLAVVGVVLLASVALSGLLTGFSVEILGWVHLEGSVVASAVLPLVGYSLAIGATTGLFMAIFRFLAQPHVSRRALLRGALLGAGGFEILKSLAAILIAQTQSRPAFQAFGVALILLVWINYFSRITLFGAAFAYTEAPAHAADAPAADAPAADVPAAGVEASGGPRRTTPAVEDPAAVGVAARRSGPSAGCGRRSGLVPGLAAGLVAGATLAAARRRHRWVRG